MTNHELDLFLRPVNPGDTTTFDIGDGRVREEHICVWTAADPNGANSMPVYRCALRWDDGTPCDTHTTDCGWHKATRTVQRQASAQDRVADA